MFKKIFFNAPVVLKNVITRLGNKRNSWRNYVLCAVICYSWMMYHSPKSGSWTNILCLGKKSCWSVAVWLKDKETNKLDFMWYWFYVTMISRLKGMYCSRRFCYSQSKKIWYRSTSCQNLLFPENLSEFQLENHYRYQKLKSHVRYSPSDPRLH